ncbi:hypothetical protein EXU48_23930 [Occultella glacieicola]|uniref:DUF304 domain-containing protein n=1 Tax=Occultella glacieicola TaxID=2518684 RepID=A0ABY2DZU9_9MICO|nr:hypothetical protein EXU48_23930 [Occultella glacieicola]
MTRPPALEGLPSPRARDCVRFVWWAQRGYWHGVRKGRGLGRALSLVLAVLWWPAVPLLLPVQLVLVARPRARYYMSPERDAVLAIVATRHGWHVEDHATTQAGTGRGRALRSLVLPGLVAIADEQQVAILATAATSDLAAAYVAELPGLVDAGRGWPRGRRLRRSPLGRPGVNP